MKNLKNCCNFGTFDAVNQLEKRLIYDQFEVPGSKDKLPPSGAGDSAFADKFAREKIYTEAAAKLKELKAQNSPEAKDLESKLVIARELEQKNSENAAREMAQSLKLHLQAIMKKQNEVPQKITEKEQEIEPMAVTKSETKPLENKTVKVSGQAQKGTVEVIAGGAINLKDPKSGGEATRDKNLESYASIDGPKTSFAGKIADDIKEKLPSSDPRNNA